MTTSYKDITPSTAQGYQAFLLPSGLRVILYYDDSPVAYAGYIIGSGSSSDPRRYFGMAHFAEHMLFKGTARRSAKQIINRMEEVGADFNAHTTKEETFVYTAFPNRYFGRVLEMMTDVLLHSACPQEELERERGVIIEEINSYLDTPSERIFDEFENLLFHGTPLGHNILGTQASVGRITQKALKDYMRNHFVASNMAFCYRGVEIDREGLFSFLNKHFTPHTATLCSLEKEKPLCSSSSRVDVPLQAAVSHRLDTFQVHRIVGFPAYSLADSRRFTLTLLCNILGGRGMNSRLNLSLREERGLVYSVESLFYPFRSVGFLAIYFATSKARLQEATTAVKEELDRLRFDKIALSELRNAKRQIVGQLTIQEDSREAAFLEMGKSFFYFNHYESLPQLVARIEQVSSEQLQEVASNIFDPKYALTLTYY